MLMVISDPFAAITKRTKHETGNDGEKETATTRHERDTDDNQISGTLNDDESPQTTGLFRFARATGCVMQISVHTRASKLASDQHMPPTPRPLYYLHVNCLQINLVGC
jgi:hypothetical protein